jgi:hypothetical protein
MFCQLEGQLLDSLGPTKKKRARGREDGGQDGDGSIEGLLKHGFFCMNSRMLTKPIFDVFEQLVRPTGFADQSKNVAKPDGL